MPSTLGKIGGLIMHNKGADALLLFDRLLGDYFLIFEGSTKEIYKLFVE